MNAPLRDRIAQAAPVRRAEQAQRNAEEAYARWLHAAEGGQDHGTVVAKWESYIRLSRIAAAAQRARLS